jgi:hypothetical protein
MSQAEDSSWRSTDYQNDSASIGAASSMTFYAEDGTDTDTKKYLNVKGGVSFGVEIFPTVACSITHINGKALKAPISVGTGGFVTNNIKLTSLTIRAGAATVVEVSMKA